MAHVEGREQKDFELVLPDRLARHGGLAMLAHSARVPIWIVPTTLVDAIFTVGRFATGPPAGAAAALARLPLAHGLRGYLTRIAPADRRQLSLL